ncbi:MAG TPA: heme exporter protein CcmD [Xanthobacteraceae bacterium]|nr:heme exporter protein CcmD [Xanthobacteraceae bacterium]
MATTPHLAFIVAAYIAAVAVVGMLTVWVAFDYRAQRRALAELETRGISRRSAPSRAAAERKAEEQA